jgi:DeoR/GlpR family transcriptional regulator of sugar metabolism
MTVAQRRKAIMELLKTKGFIKITDISSEFDVSTETARRDLDFLQGQQLLVARLGRVSTTSII